MEALTELGIALCAAAALVSLFVVLRLITRSPSSPAWQTSTAFAYMLAVPLTIATAASLAYLGFTLAAFMNIALAGLASVAVHIVLLAFIRTLLPVSEIAPVTHEAPAKAPKLDAAAA